jgi:hypothetical protein
MLQEVQKSYVPLEPRVAAAQTVPDLSVLFGLKGKL